MLIHGDALAEMRKFDANSIDAVVTDPPYGISFMSKAWDYDVPTVELWSECLRVMKPGAHALVACGTRTQHRMACNLEDAGFEVRDVVAWLYGCLSEDTEVMTEDGWMLYNTAKHRKILAYDVQNDIYQWQMPARWNEYRVKSDTAYRIQSDRTDQIVSRGHRCLVERDGTLVFISSDELTSMERVPYLQDDISSLQKGSQTVRARPSYKTTMATVSTIEYSGIIWCPTVSTGAFVARRNGKVFITGNSGFPKSHDVSKAIDKAAGHWRGRAGDIVSDNGCMSGGNYTRSPKGDAVTAAAAWAGFGTALKPAMELFTLVRKPLSEHTVAANVLRWGTGALNIDACRIESDGGHKRPPQNANNGDVFNLSKPFVPTNAEGRWPANVTHDGSQQVLELMPVTGAGGSVARFMYCAKASKSERNHGLTEFAEQATDATKFRPNHADKAADGHRGTPYGRFTPVKNNHPTVKPVKLMLWLCSLITPPGGVVLDPFMGSGTTGIACAQAGFQFIGIERELPYVQIAEARIAAA